ncbi:MAG: coiled-coil protein [Candidatus Helarchaeota archaeon]
MAKKKKIKLSLENLKDFDPAPETVITNGIYIPQRKVEVQETKEKENEVLDSEVEYLTPKEEGLYKQIEKWKIALSINKKMRDDSQLKIKDWKTKRDELKEEIKEHRAKALEAKLKRDKINQEITKLKNERNETNKKTQEFKKKRNELYNKTKKLRKELTQVLSEKKELKAQLEKVRKIQKKIDQLEWVHQTKPMTWEDEKGIMERIESLYSELNKFEEVQKQISLSEELNTKFKSIDEMKNEASKYHELMLQCVKESEDIHQKLIRKVKESENYHNEMSNHFAQCDKLRIEEKNAHQLMVENLRELDLLRKGSEQAKKEIDRMKKKLSSVKKKYKGKKNKKFEHSLNIKAKNALTKYKAGEKLTFEEYQILMRRDLLK